jgi:3-oxoacyl-[acyl-carrier protein] reductase
MDLGIAGRRAAVAAATAGLGYASAEALVEEGVRVAICGRDPERTKRAAESLGGDTIALAHDVSEPTGAAAFVDAAKESLGGIDILIANGGGPPPGPALGADLEGLRASVDRCLLSMVAMCQGVLPAMQEQGFGRIVAITSGGVREPLGNMVYSNTARAGLTGYLKTLSREVIGSGVTVNSLLPMSIETERLRSLMGDHMEAMLAAVPAGRGGSAAHFGRVAAFLCSQWADYVSGVALPVDGAALASLT